MFLLAIVMSVLLLLAIVMSVFFDIQILIIPLVSSNSSLIVVRQQTITNLKSLFSRCTRRLSVTFERSVVFNNTPILINITTVRYHITGKLVPCHITITQMMTKS